VPVSFKRKREVQSTKNDAAAVALQVLESIRTTHPALIADNMPADWGMNKLREALGQGKSVDTIHELYIKIAADTIATLRKVDVFRVIESVRPDNIDGVSRASLSRWISAQRPDLSEEVADVLQELAN
jgi:hypothetical protein